MFKVGDKAKLISRPEPDTVFGFEIGDIVTIEKTDYDPDEVYHCIEISQIDGYHGYCDEENLERVDE